MLGKFELPLFSATSGCNFACVHAKSHNKFATSPVGLRYIIFRDGGTKKCLFVWGQVQKIGSGAMKDTTLRGAKTLALVALSRHPKHAIFKGGSGGGVSAAECGLLLTVDATTKDQGTSTAVATAASSCVGCTLYTWDGDSNSSTECVDWSKCPSGQGMTETSMGRLTARINGLDPAALQNEDVQCGHCPSGTSSPALTRLECGDRSVCPPGHGRFNNMSKHHNVQCAACEAPYYSRRQRRRVLQPRPTRPSPPRHTLTRSMCSAPRGTAKARPPSSTTPLTDSRTLASASHASHTASPHNSSTEYRRVQSCSAKSQ